MGTAVRRMPLAVMVICVLALPLVGAQAAHAAQKPDLVVTRVVWESVNFVLRNVGQPLRWRDRTKNIGAARARRSKTALRIRRAEWTTPTGAYRSVPSLLPRRSNGGPGGTRYDFDPGAWLYGTHQVAICADATRRVAERRERNNCKTMPEPLYVVPRFISGSVSGSHTYAGRTGVTETWVGTVTFEGFDYTNGGNGYFGFVPTGGSVTYTLQGTDQFNCVWTGGGTVQVPTGESGGGFTLVFGPGSYYTGSGLIGSGWGYTATETCPSNTYVHPAWGPLNPLYLNMLSPSLDDPSSGSLAGSFTEMSGRTTWNWNLTASD